MGGALGAGAGVNLAALIRGENASVADTLEAMGWGAAGEAGGLVLAKGVKVGYGAYQAWQSGGSAAEEMSAIGLRRIARSLGAGGDEVGLQKAVNSNLPHAIDRAVEHGVFASPEDAGAGLRALSDMITKTRTFPEGTLVDTAREARFLVPVGENGLAVYQLAGNGTAKLKTVLKAR